MKKRSIIVQRDVNVPEHQLKTSRPSFLSLEILKIISILFPQICTVSVEAMVKTLKSVVSIYYSLKITRQYF